MHILVIDDEKTQRDILADILRDAGYSVTCAADGDEGLQQIAENGYSLILTDLKMPGKDGFAVLEEALKINPHSQVIIMTAFGSIPSAVNAIKNGAYDYLTKPFKKDELLRVISRAAEKVRLLEENERLKNEVTQRYSYHNLIGGSAAMRKIYGLIEKIKDIDATVLISGESGTGKEMVARAIHYSGKRKDGPFVALNCGAIPETLIESELFGHEKGAFTGAHKDYIGKFEQAQGGTIFLDEIGTMRMDLQIRLLRVLQEKRVSPVGSNRTIDLDVRVIAATNEDLQVKVDSGAFRTDLYHRLNVFHLHLPALRDRKEDIPLLVRHFAERYAQQYKKPLPLFGKSAVQKLESYGFPGNIRELEHVIEKTIILSDKKHLEAQDLIMPDPVTQTDPPTSLVEMEKQMIIDTLKEMNGSIKKTAEKLGITYKTLQYRIKKYNITRRDFI